MSLSLGAMTFAFMAALMTTDNLFGYDDRRSSTCYRGRAWRRSCSGRHSAMPLVAAPLMAVLVLVEAAIHSAWKDVVPRRAPRDRHDVPHRRIRRVHQRVDPAEQGPGAEGERHLDPRHGHRGRHRAVRVPARDAATTVLEAVVNAAVLAAGFLVLFASSAGRSRTWRHGWLARNPFRVAELLSP